MSGSSNKPSDPKKLPVPWKRGVGEPDIVHQEQEWASGTRGGGKLPADFEWTSNPKQYQEENGAGDVEQPISK